MMISRLTKAACCGRNNGDMILLQHRAAYRLLSSPKDDIRVPFSVSLERDATSTRLERHHRRFSSSSVSVSEVSKFSKFAESWWNPTDNPLIGMNTIRMEYIINQQEQKSSLSSSGSSTKDTDDLQHHLPLSNLSALDIGCGGGLLSESLARLGATVTAIDPSEELVVQAQKHAQLDPRTRYPNIDYRGGWSVEQLAECEEYHSKFDMICLLEVIEHVTNPASLLVATKSLLKPGGRLYISTMNRTIKSRIVAIVGAEYIMRYLPVGTHDWNSFLSPEEVRGLMYGAGFHQIDVCGMVIDSPPIGSKWSWKLDSKDTDINWIGTYQLK